MELYNSCEGSPRTLHLFADILAFPGLVSTFATFALFLERGRVPSLNNGNVLLLSAKINFLSVGGISWIMVQGLLKHTFLNVLLI